MVIAGRGGKHRTARTNTGRPTTTRPHRTTGRTTRTTAASTNKNNDRTDNENAHANRQQRPVAQSRTVATKRTTGGGRSTSERDSSDTMRIQVADDVDRRNGERGSSRVRWKWREVRATAPNTVVRRSGGQREEGKKGGKEKTLRWSAVTAAVRQHPHGKDQHR